MRWSHFSKLKHLTVSRKWWSTFSMLKTLRVIRKWWSPFPLLKYLRQWWCPFSVLKTLRGVRKWRSPFYSSKNFNSHNAVVELFWIFKGFNPNLSGLFRGSFWGGGEVKLPHPPCLKLVRIMLETSNLARKYKSIFSFRKYIQKSEIYPKIQKMTMTPEFSGMTSLSNFLTLFSFFCPVSLLIQVSCQYVSFHWISLIAMLQWHFNLHEERCIAYFSKHCRSYFPTSKINGFTSIISEASVASFP